MFKKSLIAFIIIIGTVFSFGIITETFAAGTQNPPEVNCIGLPGCVDKNIENPTPASKTNNLGIQVITNIVGTAIQYVAVFAVLALILSGIMYLISGGEEEKVKKAKTWITWSLVGVFLSVSAWGIINIINNLSIS